MIVITAPTGHIGHQVLERVVDGDKPIRVIVRDPARLPSSVRKRVDVVQGSHGDRNVVTKAFEGAHTVFWLVPPDPKAKSVDAAYVDFTRPACDAIKSQGVKRVLVISPLGRGLAVAERAGFVTASLKMDDLIASTNVDCRPMTMPSFMDNILMQLESIKTNGRFFSPIDGDRQLPACATRDIAAVAARLLVTPTWKDETHTAVLGPEDLSFNDMARIMSEVLNRPIKFQQSSLHDYKAGFIKRGMSDAMAKGMTDMADAKNNGLDNAEPRTRENTTPTSFKTWCEEILKPAISA